MKIAVDLLISDENRNLKNFWSSQWVYIKAPKNAMFAYKETQIGYLQVYHFRSQQYFL